MSNWDKTGGGACPTPDTENANGDVMYGEPGMTLLDHFAGLAMQSMINNFDKITVKAGGPITEMTVAYQAYEFAAAMLLARAKYLEGEQ